jgi:inhibitor of KinA
MIKLRPAGDAGLMIEFGTEISADLSRRVYGLFRRLQSDAALSESLTCIPAFCTLLLQFDPLRTDAGEIQRKVLKLIEEPEQEGSNDPTLWNIPVCYHPGLAPDLERAAQCAGLSVQDYQSYHSAETYTVYMLGGFPGFPYMGDVPARLQLPRLTTPRLRIEPGSVAVAGNLTAIYPAATPGGWNLVGRTPVPIFDLQQDSPALISPGDDVQFVPISIDEFEDMRASVAARTFDLLSLRAKRA